MQVAKSLAETVLTPPGQQVKVLRVSPVSTPLAVCAGPADMLQPSHKLALHLDHQGPQQASVVCWQRRAEDRNYLEFEFAAKSNTYIRLALAVVTVANGAL
jgi:hypothetical protein